MAEETTDAPPRLQAAVFRAIARLDGVTLKRDADVAGRPAIAVGRVTDGYLFGEILLDPESYAYLAERDSAVKDHTSTGADGRWTVERGAVVNLGVFSIPRIVDRAGRRS